MSGYPQINGVLPMAYGNSVQGGQGFYQLPLDQQFYDQNAGKPIRSPAGLGSQLLAQALLHYGNPQVSAPQQMQLAGQPNLPSQAINMAGVNNQLPDLTNLLAGSGS